MQNVIEELVEEVKAMKSLGSRLGLTAKEADDTFKVDEMLDNEPDDHAVFLADMEEDTSSDFDPDEEYDVDAEEPTEFDYSDDE